MSFQDVPKIEKPTFYLDVAFGRARKRAKSPEGRNKLEKIRVKELSKLEIVSKTLQEKLRTIITKFPNIDNLTEFYNELIRALLEYKQLKKSLGAVNWAQQMISEYTGKYKGKIKGARSLDDINKHKKEYYGRISSFIKQISDELEYLEESRKVIKGFPSIKEGYFTVAIAGFPNVGKTTLLSKLTSSKPDIQAYPFTTKNLNIGYLKEGVKKIQFIDTPGTLNREDKMNEIEKIAYLAIKYCADMIIYVYDITEPYSLENQKKLFKRIKEFDRPTFKYMSKTDVLPAERIKEFSIETIKDIEELRKKVLETSSSRLPK